VNFQYGWDDTFEEDLLKLQALFVNPSTEVFTENYLLQQSVHCYTKFYYILQQLWLTGFLILENQS